MATIITTPSTDNRLLADQPIINLKWPERYISVIAGVKVGLSGFKNLFKSPMSSIIKIGTGGYLLNRGITGHCDIYEKAGKTGLEPVEIDICTSITVDKPRQEVYDFWRKLDNLPLFMAHLKSVEVLDDDTSRWSLKLPIDIANITWDAEITYDEPGNAIAWQALPNTVIQTTGQVRFMDTPTSGQTLLHVTITYQPPAGVVGAGIAQLINPVFQKMVEDDVLNFKRYMDMSTVIEPLTNDGLDDIILLN